MTNASKKNSSKSDRCRVFDFVVLILFALTVILPSPCRAQSRRLKVGQTIPEFSAKTIDGKTFEYKHSGKKILLICFLSADQKRSKGAADDLMRLTRSIKCEPQQIDFLVVVDKPGAQKLLIADSTAPAKITPEIVVDQKFAIWGKFGIIALPTIIIGNSDHKVALAAPGYGYDFYGQMEAKLNFVLGLGPDISTGQLKQVRTISNNSLKNKVARNIKMAAMLKEKGKYEMALMIAKKAAVLDPNSVDVKLFLGELNCLADKPEEAMKSVEGISLEDKERSVRSSLMLIKGWAARRMKNNAEAEKYLLQAVKLEPLSVRSLYELGNLYSQTGQHEKAARAYRSALKLTIGREE